MGATFIRRRSSRILKGGGRGKKSTVSPWQPPLCPHLPAPSAPHLKTSGSMLVPAACASSNNSASSVVRSFRRERVLPTPPGFTGPVGSREGPDILPARAEAETRLLTRRPSDFFCSEMSGADVSISPLWNCGNCSFLECLSLLVDWTLELQLPEPPWAVKITWRGRPMLGWRAA